MRLCGLAILGVIVSGSASPILAQSSPEAPETLEQHFVSAQLQVESKAGDCATRLDGVQRDLGMAAANPALDILQPAGRARLASIEYRLHIGRAYCGGGAPRRNELHAALDAALRAVPLYRDLYDFQSMLIMQYDVAVTYRLLGEQDQAMAALETVVKWDGDYGYADDAEENRSLLRSWQSPSAAPEPAQAVTGLETAPHRSVTLNFAWRPVEADVAIEADYSVLSGRTLVHAKADTLLRRRIVAKGEDWELASEDGADRHYDLGAVAGKPDDDLAKILATMAAEQMLPPDLEISYEGEFKSVREPSTMSASLLEDIKSLSGALLSDKKQEAVVEPTALMGLSAQQLAKLKGVVFKAEQDYDLGISSWIDATLDQGVWYDMQASLLLPGMAVTIDHDIQFAYSRPVPCTADTAVTDCAEILVHATPNPEALQRWLDAVRGPFSLQGKSKAHFASAIDLRLVVDPKRLLPYVTEARRHWYFALDGKGDPMIGSESAISTYRYQ